MKKFLKYTGSKNNEYKIIKQYLPQIIHNYYEPFFGSGAVFFGLQYDNLIQNKSYCNDLSCSLIRFYNSIKEEEFKERVLQISNCWDEIGTYDDNTETNLSKIVVDTLKDKFKDCLLNKEQVGNVFDDKLINFINDVINNKFHNLATFNFHDKDFVRYICNDLIKRITRFSKKEINDINVFTNNIIETSLHQAFYMTIRDMYNEWNLNTDLSYTECEKSAHWYFIRQFAWGGMFRFGKNDKFNIPYGGLSYNKKCFKCDIDALYKTKNIEFITNENTIFTNEDYSKILQESDFTENDFIFLDPPYDSTFSTYDNLIFGNEKQIELAHMLYNTKYKWMLVIKKTPLIEELYYGKDGINVIEYDKKYTYAAKGEYENNVKHLIIKNYE